MTRGGTPEQPRAEPDPDSLSEEAARNTLALNPLIGLRGKDLMDGAATLLKAMVNEPWGPAAVPCCCSSRACSRASHQVAHARQQQRDPGVLGFRLTLPCACLRARVERLLSRTPIVPQATVVGKLSVELRPQGRGPNERFTLADRCVWFCVRSLPRYLSR